MRSWWIEVNSRTPEPLHDSDDFDVFSFNLLKTQN
jgi:hypothetical protein